VAVPPIEQLGGGLEYTVAVAVAGSDLGKNLTTEVINAVEDQDIGRRKGISGLLAAGKRAARCNPGDPVGQDLGLARAFVAHDDRKIPHENLVTPEPSVVERLPAMPRAGLRDTIATWNRVASSCRISPGLIFSGKFRPVSLRPVSLRPMNRSDLPGIDGGCCRMTHLRGGPGTTSLRLFS